ncbi:hypothetical protein COX09_01540 [Candidatus Beckwithbacteria bacterium CG23_combo_of_CG06-09_8_20_14_all_47_9]|uniref:DUF916 domain-containing protein n=1 Tax=Candidatus Beckwithbacteria bacterium CG23_combo_of_CG06-09_8_20_14_all_47_9 TaxID=1974498 RepID=A0A2H0B655_9BACT|nr:MAG: hypothetical protein COX09_01540 [Candidatus Beckwithbacteria bacterium CG23_combo_of_CG06-09_8_20_14_all_47_9]
MKKFLPLLFLLIAAPVLGQEKLSMTAIPPRLEIEALPGGTVQESLRIRNETGTDQAYKVIVADFIVTGNQGTPIPVTEAVSGRWSLASWISVSPKQILVPAGQTAGVDLIISVPQDGLPGGHYAMVTYAPIAEGSLAQGTGAQISPQVGSLVYLKVIGDVTEAVNLKEFKADNKFKHYGPTPIMAEIENLGDIHLRPIGKLTVTNWLGDETYSAELEEKNIFPFASRTYDWTVPGKWHLGRYAARLTAQAGDAAIPLTGLIYFWIVPVKEISVIAAALAIIILLVILKKRRKNLPPE